MGENPVKQISKTHAWLSMMRISNSPTVLSNILVGTAIAITMQSKYWTLNLSYDSFFAICILVVYFAGMILNDAFDANYDKKHRPDRPIPSGLIPRSFAWIAGLTLLGAVSVFGIGHGAANGLVLLVLAVLLYTFLHRWFVPALVLMAICRGLVYFIVANPSQSDDMSFLITFCLVLAFYTAVLTCIGRFENDKSTKFTWITWVLLVSPAYIVFAYLPNSWIASIPLVYMVYWIWLAWSDFKSNNKISGMHRTISGFCLLDCVLATSLEQYVIAGLCALCFIITVAFHRRILGT
jgi:4-hydroxybenzoate polyprenyltransferase